jgi:DeoR family glycerol-3-phosphate regulon repressor
MRTSGPKLLARRRHDEIQRRVAAEGAVRVSDLAAEFGVSGETIRRDLKHLADRGQVDLVHGGAARLGPVELPFEARAEQNAAGKAAIGRTAAALVEDHMAVLFDSGTTTLTIAQALTARRGLTVCTGSLAIAQLMCRVPDTIVYLLGGRVDPTEEAAGGLDVLDAIGRFHFDLAFVGGGALSPDGEVTDFTRAGAEQRGRMIGAAARSFFVVDSTKFGIRSPLRIPNVRSASGLITDKRPPEDLAKAIAATGVPLIVAASC